MSKTLAIGLLVGVGGWGCSKEAAPGNLADFHATPGQREAECTKDNDGKRFRVEGYLKLRDTTSVDEKNKLATLDLVDDREQQKAWVGVDLKVGKHIDFDLGKAKADGYRRTSAAIEGLSLHADNGDAKLADKLAVTFDVNVITQFQTKEISACTYVVAGLHKL